MNYDLSLVIIIYFINIVLYFLTFSWIIMMEKEKCACSADWKRDYIKYYLMSMIMFILLMFVHTLVFSNRYEYIFQYVKYVFLLSELVFIAIVFIYIRDLIRKRCECSNSIARDITLIYTITDGIIIILSLLLASIIGIFRFIS
jgi:hypothetical protein